MLEPNLQDVVAYYDRQAAQKEAEAAMLSTRANALMVEAKSLRKLAQDTEAQFPQAKRVMKNDGPYLANMPQLTSKELSKELLKKAGRVSHVAQRLKVSEKVIRDLLNAPDSEFYVAARGWIMPRPAQEAA